MGGIFLHQGNIAEMKTGEGKTLVATLPAYLNALTGKGVHVVTVNDYLAKRDADWMGKVYHAARADRRRRRAQHARGREEAPPTSADITYATNNELGFDYLRDNMKSDLAQMVQRDHYFAIVDEVDSILIDEARTPLIISGPSQDRSELYITRRQADPRADARALRARREAAQRHPDRGRQRVSSSSGCAQMGSCPRAQTLYDPESTTIVHHVNQALRAHMLFHKDKDYIVRDGEVMLIDEFTGRMMTGPPAVGRPAPGDRGQGRRHDPARERDARLGHLPELLPALREARRA